MPAKTWEFGSSHSRWRKYYDDLGGVRYESKGQLSWSLNKVAIQLIENVGNRVFHSTMLEIQISLNMMKVAGITASTAFQNTADKYDKLAKERKTKERLSKQQQQLVQLQRT